MIVVKHKGDFEKTTKFLNGVKKADFKSILSSYGKMGVDALSRATPVDTGLTSQSWSYDIYVTRKGFSITWSNSNVNDGVPIAIVLQYGHATRSGGFVQGRDYINPAIKPVMDDIAENLWKEVTKL